MRLDPEAKAVLPWMLIAYGLFVVLEHSSTTVQGGTLHVLTAIRWVGCQFAGRPLPQSLPSFKPSLVADAIGLASILFTFVVFPTLVAMCSRRQPPAPTQERSP